MHRSPGLLSLPGDGKETNMHTTIEEHALKQGRYILILHGTPLHFIWTLDECKALKNKWDAKIRSHR